jgi:copper(I)-binding protein
MKLLLISTLITLNALAASVTVKNSHVRLLPPGAMATGVFMALTNTTDKDIKLIKATSKRSKLTEIHNHFNVDGVMKMREVPFINIPAKGMTMLKPGSFHIMLIKLNGALKLNEKVTINLEFDNGEKLTITPLVKKIQMKHMKH